MMLAPEQRENVCPPSAHYVGLLSAVFCGVRLPIGGFVHSVGADIDIDKTLAGLNFLRLQAGAAAQD
jgi:hypothetical protein